MRWLTLVTLVILVGNATKADPPTTNEWKGPPWLADHEGKLKVLAIPVRGTVVKVTADSITVLPEGKEKAVTYPAHPMLKNGEGCRWETEANCYLLEDVKREDVVILRVGAVDKTKEEECFTIMMYWRPGEDIPPSRKPDKLTPYHKEQQRQVEYEMRGEYTPEEIESQLRHIRFNARKGLPPPPPLPEKKKLVKAKLPLEEKDEPKK